MGRPKIGEPGTVYFLGETGTPFVKIGCTLGEIYKRKRTLQTGNPRQLYLHLAVEIAGDAGLQEREFQSFYAEYRVVGEWFEVPDAFDDWYAKWLNRSPDWKTEPRGKCTVFLFDLEEVETGVKVGSKRPCTLPGRHQGKHK